MIVCADEIEKLKKHKRNEKGIYINVLTRVSESR